MKRTYSSASRSRGETPSRGSVGWCEALVRQYEDIRDDVCGKWWDSIDALLHRRVFGGNRIDPDDLQARCVEPPRVNQITNTIVAQLFNRRPTFVVDPATVDYEEVADAARVFSDADWQRDYAAVRNGRLCVQDCAQKGMGIMYTIPEQDYEAAKIRRRRALARTKQLRQSLALSLAPRPDPLPAPGLEWAPTGVENRDDQRVGRSVSRRLDPRKVFFDWTAGDEAELFVVGREYYATKDSVDRQTHWNAAAKGRIKYAAVDPDDFLQPVDGEFYPKALIREGFFKDAEGRWNLKIWWADAPPNTGFLYEADSPLEYGHPYRFLRWSDTGSMMWAPSDILNVYQSIVMERHLLTRWYDQMMRQGVDVNLVDAEALTEDQLSPLEMDGVGLLIRLHNTAGRPLESYFHRIKKDVISPETLQFLGLISQQIQDGLGLNVNMQGQYGKSETSATEAQSVKQYSDVTWAPRHAAMDEFISGIATDRLRQGIQFADPEMLAAVAGPAAAQVLLDAHLTPGDIQFGLHLRVTPGSMQPPSDVQKLQALQTAMASILQGNPLATALLDGPQIGLEFFKLLGFAEGSKFLRPGVTSEALLSLARQQMERGGSQGSAPAPPGQSNAPGMRAVG